MDLKLVQSLNNLAGTFPWLDVIMIFIAEKGLFVVAILLVTLWFMDLGVARKKNQYAIIMGLEALLLGRGVVTIILREIFPRVRPFVDNNSINLLIAKDAFEPSFPSGHAVMGFALALAVFIYNRKAGIWLIVVSVLIGLARVFAGAHYPSDIIGGFFVALGVVFFLNYYRHIFVAPVVNFFNKKGQ